MKRCLFLYNSMSPFSRKKVYGDELSGERLSQLPESLWQLSQLQVLYLNGNQLTAVPETLGQLSQLEELDLSSNQLTDVPETFRRLTSLQALYLHGNEALNLPTEVLGPTRQDVN